MTHDSQLGQIHVTLPEMIMRIEQAQLIEDESHIRHQNLVCELADSHPLRATVGLSGPVGRKFQLMPVWEHRDQRIRGMIGGDNDESAAREALSQNGVNGRYNG